jgi:large subunit ribosomal protein L23
MSRSPVEIVFGPVITERSYAESLRGRYTFKVANDATKPEIAKALEEHYQGQSVKVEAVNTVTMHGKTRRAARGGVRGRTSDWKKAIVTLAKGQRIEGLFGGV